MRTQDQGKVMDELMSQTCKLMKAVINLFFQLIKPKVTCFQPTERKYTKLLIIIVT